MKAGMMCAAAMAALTMLQGLTAEKVDAGKTTDGESGHPPAKVVNATAEILLSRIKLRLATRMGDAVEFFSRTTGIPMTVAQEDSAVEVTLAVENVTIGEALRKMKDATKLDYRVLNGAILFATPARFAAIDAGTAKYIPDTSTSTDYGYKLIWTDDRAYSIESGKFDKIPRSVWPWWA